MQSPSVNVVEGGARRKSRKPCPKGKVRGSKSKRCHFRRKAGPHRKSAPSSARRLRGGEVPEIAVSAEPILTAGALEEAFQAGLEAGRAFRGGLEINLTQEAPAPIAGGAVEPVAPLEAGKRRSKKRSAKRSAKKRSAKRSMKKRSARKSHKKGRKMSRRA